ncbi:MAG: hypothetical protein E6929_06035 [Clostridium sp.]|nr:hypothetical protein [Clostridium sp.]
MKLSKREKILVILLAFFLVGVAYYELVFIKQRERVENLKTKKESVEGTYNNMVTSIKNMEKNDTNIKICKESIEAKSMKLYPKLYQDKIIIEINDLLDKAEIKGSLSFSEVTVANIAKYFGEEAEKEEVKGEPSLKEPADELRKLSDEDKDSNNTDSNKGEKTDIPVESLFVEQMQVGVDFTGSYENATKFIKLLSDYARLIALPNVALTSTGDDQVAGNVNLEFYSIPKFTDEDGKYLDWTLNNTYGKSNPFKSDSTVSTSSRGDEEKKYDFVMSVNGSNSDLPSMAMGKESDVTRDTYIYFDKNEKVDVDIEINEENGKYYVKYKTGNSSYPSNYNENGVEVNPGEGSIKIGVYSSSRLGAEDKVSVNINVTSNTTSKVTEIVVMDEDKSNPRVTVNTSGNAKYYVK